jgi:hypothetical protein
VRPQRRASHGGPFLPATLPSGTARNKRRCDRESEVVSRALSDSPALAHVFQDPSRVRERGGLRMRSCRPPRRDPPAIIASRGWGCLARARERAELRMRVFGGSRRDPPVIIVSGGWGPAVYQSCSNLAPSEGLLSSCQPRPERHKTPVFAGVLLPARPALLAEKIGGQLRQLACREPNLPRVVQLLAEGADRLRGG